MKLLLESIAKMLRRSINKIMRDINNRRLLLTLVYMMIML